MALSVTLYVLLLTAVKVHFEVAGVVGVIEMDVGEQVTSNPPVVAGVVVALPLIASVPLNPLMLVAVMLAEAVLLPFRMPKLAMLAATLKSLTIIVTGARWNVFGDPEFVALTVTK